MANNSENYQLTAPAIMLYPNLLTAKSVMKNGKPTGEPKFSVNLALAPDHPDLLPMKKLVAKLALEKWPGRDLRVRGTREELAFPFTDGTILADKAKQKVEAGAAGARLNEHSRGFIIIPCRSKYQPALACIINGRPTDLNTDDLIRMHGDKFFMGAECIVTINFLAYDKVDERGFDGVTARLNAVAVTGKGTRIGGRSAAHMLEGATGHTTMEDPTNDAPF